jgi:hypothetical protein
MALLDTSVWVDHLRGNDLLLASLLLQKSVLSHPFVWGELALGNLRQRDTILAALDNLSLAPLVFADEIYYFTHVTQVATKSRYAAPSTGVFIGNRQKGCAREAARCQRDRKSLRATPDKNARAQEASGIRAA